MDVCTQYGRYVRHCARSRVIPQSFGRFVVDVFPFTFFACLP
jgi:hypothetical protein